MRKFYRTFALEICANYDENNFQWEKTVKENDHTELSERVKHFTKDMGLMICGTYDQNDRYEREHYIPFFLGKGEKKFDEIARLTNRNCTKILRV